MSLKAKYQTLKKITIVKGDEWTGGADTETSVSFKGLIQAPSNSNTFFNGKDTTSVNGILFTDIKTVIAEKDIIEDTNGTRYLVSASGSQPIGITGITPKRGQHAEYSLVYANKGL